MITQDYLKSILHYDKNTGMFTWIKSSNRKIRLGVEAGWMDSSSGYKRMKLLGKTYLQHRLAWLYSYGTWPSKEIDHIDGDVLNNSLTNLRDVYHYENMKNKKGHRGGRLFGCYFDKVNNKWKAQLIFNKKRIFIGRYDLEKTAHEAYISMKWLLSEVEKL